MNSVTRLLMVLFLSTSLVFAQETKPIERVDLEALKQKFLSEMTENERYVLLLDYVKKAENEDNLDMLEVYIELGTEFEKYITELHEKKLIKDQEYIGRVATQLASEAISKILKSETTAPADLIKYFKQLTSDNAAFQIMNFWRQRIPSISKKDRLFELTVFFNHAQNQLKEKHPDFWGENAWPRREAAYTLDAAAFRLLMEFELSADEAAQAIQMMFMDESLYRYFEKIMISASSEELTETQLIAKSKALKAILSKNDKNNWAAYVRASAQTASDFVNAQLILRDKIVGDEMIDYFKSINSENVRNNVLQEWTGKLEDYTDPKSLFDLAKFFYGAYIDTIDKGNDKWIVERAKLGEQIARSRIDEFCPVYEGSYEIKIKSKNYGNAPKNTIDRLTLLNTHSSESWRISLANSKNGIVNYSFSNIEIDKGGRFFHTTNVNSNGSLTHLEVRYDPISAKVNGKITSPDQFETIEFEGSQIFSSYEIYKNRKPYSPQGFESEKINTLTFKNEEYTLIIKRMEHKGEKFLSATLSYEKDKKLNTKINFQDGYWFEEVKVFAFLGGNPEFGHSKLIVTLDLDENNAESASLLMLNSNVGHINNTKKIKLKRIR